MQSIIKYNSLVEQIGTLVKSSQQKLLRTINTSITITYWHIGKHIVEFEQGGNTRAKYGAELLRKLSQDLTEQFGKGYSYRNLQLAKKFYNTFPIVQSVIAQSDTAIPPIEKALLSNKKQSF